MWNNHLVSSLESRFYSCINTKISLQANYHQSIFIFDIINKLFISKAKQTAKTTAKTAAKETTKETTKIVAKETGKVVAKVGTDAAVAAVGTVASCETGPAAPLIGAAAGIVIGGAVGEAVGTQMDIADAKMNSRNRKIRFFLDKMKEEDKQQDSVLPIERAKTFSNRSYIFICNSIYTIGKYYIIKNDWGTCN